MLDEALAEPTPEARVARYLAINMERLARIERGEEQAFAVLSDLRAMEEPVQAAGCSPAGARCSARRAACGAPTAAAPQTDLHGARAHVLLENTFWLPIVARPLRARPISTASRRG